MKKKTKRKDDQVEADLRLGKVLVAGTGVRRDVARILEKGVAVGLRRRLGIGRLDAVRTVGLSVAVTEPDSFCVLFILFVFFGRETWKRIETGGSYLELRRFDVGSFGRGANVSETVTVFGVDT